MVQIPTTKEIKDLNLTNLESELGQEAPILKTAFLRVLAATEALVQTGQYKVAVRLALQNLASTATGEDLKKIGSEYGVEFKVAEAAVLEAELPATTGTTIPAGTQFRGVLNNVTYVTNSTVVAAAGIATLEMTAQTAGTVGNLTNGSELAIVQSIPDAESIASVTDTINVGAQDENEEVYRERVLFAIRAVFGGGNSSDYKAWAEVVAGVKRVYPFAGKPVGVPGSCPGDRTIYVEATSNVDPDGVAPPALLAEVRAAINISPETGKEQIPLGLEDSLLYVDSIVRSIFYVKITGLVVDSAKEADLKADIALALDTYFRNSVRPYVVGVDSVFDKNDVVTQNFVSEVVADPLKLYEASCGKVEFSKDAGVPSPVLSLTVDNNELAKLGDVTYV